MGLPPLSPNGRRLIAAIAKRQVLPVPDVPISAEQRGSYWSDGDADLIAKSYDRYTEAARLLGKLFHPSWNGGYGEVNWSPSRGCPRCTDGATTEAIPVAKSNFNPDQPRVPKGQSDGGQWTTEGETQGPQANFRTAQEIILPLPESVPMTVPRILPPTEIVPPPLDIPNIDERAPVDNPFPNKRRCVEEWAAARKFCDEQRQKGTFKPGYRGFGKNYDKCLLGQVSEACGGNKYDRGRGKNRPIA